MSPRLLVVAVCLVLGCKNSEPQSHRKPDSSTNGGSSARTPAITEIDGVDLTVVPPEQRNDALRLLNESTCYCGCPRTLAGCLSARSECTCVNCSERMTQFILNEYKTGASTEDVEAQLLEGFAEGYNAKQLTFDETDQPMKGAKDAKYVIVEFADFRCPHCAAAAEELETLLQKRNDARLVYYYFPLGGMNADLSVRASEAAEEARQQGKFWELSTILFREQHALEEEDLVKYAEQAGLDLVRFKAAMASRVHKEKVLADKRLGESMGIRATPTIYVNGRPFGLGRTAENLEMRFAMENERGRCE
jgi:protein-disulfide isomerase